MTTLDAEGVGYRALNEQLRDTAKAGDAALVRHCCGQRFLAAGFTGGKITIEGVPGNALGAYLNGTEISVRGNAQDAVGDTMNEGKIIIHGNTGDAVGYAMRGGAIYVEGNAGYRAGIHMKEYQGKRPAIVIGGRCGSFLGEYQAGGVLIVLGLTAEQDGKNIVGNCPFTGMHGGKAYLRCTPDALPLPGGVTAALATEEDMAEIAPYLEEYCRRYGADKQTLLASPFTKVQPDSKNPYKQMYVAN